MYAKVYGQIFDSSLRDKWQGWVTFVALLVLADADDEVDMTLGALQARTGLPGAVLEEGIRILEQPDIHSRTPDEDGRRIVRLDEHRPWGWRIVNRGKYKRMRDNEERREYFRRQKQAKRGGTPLSTTCPPVSTDVHQRPPQAVGSRQEAVGIESESKTTPVRRSVPETPGQESVVELVLRDGTMFGITQAQVSRWERLFPDVLVMDTLREMGAWLDANPQRRKTRRGALRFVTGWLLREQNTPRRTDGPQAHR